MTRQKWILAAVIVALAAGVVYMNIYYRRSRGPEVEVEAIERRDLEAVVSASGKIQPKRLVNISADTMGRVTELAVEEGERVSRGQFLMLIDPESAESAVEMGEAGIRAAKESANAARDAVETAEANLDLSRINLARVRELHKDEVISKDALDRAESEVKVRESELDARKTQVRAQEEQLAQQVANLRSARHVLSKVTIDAPMEGVITRLSIEEGETVVVGTMNNAGTVLMTIADLSVIQAELEVDETDIVDVRLGQMTMITIDAFPDVEYRGEVTKIGSSAKQANGMLGGGGNQQGTNFEVEVTLSDEVPGVRPDFSCSAEIVTSTRSQAVAVPIQALTVRELEVDPAGEIVRWDPDEREERRRADLAEGHSLEELEGVFVFRDGKVEFTPVTIGIAGERYFEVLEGLSEGDEVVIGPYSSVREIEDGDRARLEDPDD